MKNQLAIFDLDGTILDTLEDLADSVNYALRTNHMPERSIEEVRRFVGNGIHKLIERAVLPQSSPEQIEQVFQLFTAYYKEHCAEKTRPYEGILEVLHTLKEHGVRTAVVSNKGDFAVQILCRDYFTGLLDFAVGEKEGIRRKPAPDSVLAVLDQFQIKKEQAVYIGDSEVDVQTAKNAGIQGIAVTWGFRGEADLEEAGADCIVHTMEELEKAL